MSARPSSTTCFIGGKHVAAEETYTNIDPSEGSSLGEVSRSTTVEVDAAVASGWSTFPAWRAAAPVDRGRTLLAIASNVTAHASELARLETEDTGKPLSQSLTDAHVCARYFEFYGNALASYYGDHIPLGPEYRAFTTHEPLGVIGNIVAWNYPMQLLARGVAPAIATGNCAVLKPADETPRTAVRIAELAVAAGLPPGVFNVVTGLGAEAGHALATHEGVRALGFVGSFAVGQRIAAAAANRVVPCLLELGGKSPQVVFDDASLDDAVIVIVKAILQNAGQTCSAGSRLLVHRKVHDELVSAIAARFESTTVGPGLADCDLGPLISERQRERVHTMVTAASGDLIAGGHSIAPEGSQRGYFYAPTLLDGIDPISPIAQEEVFGPVLAVTVFDDEDEAVSIANGTDYALLGSVWTGDVSRALRVADRIEAGQVYVNAYGAGGGVELPFGGFRQSGYGREKGLEALDAFTATKTTIIRL